MIERPVFVTLEGQVALLAELDELRRVTQVEVATRMAAAKEQGDPAENPEFQAARETQGFVLGRIQEIEELLRHAQLIVAPGDPQAGIVQIGATVTVRDAAGVEDTYAIRGSVEANPSAHIISNESPLAQALLGQPVGATVMVHSPVGAYQVTIVQVG